jgi:hypothetical protein
LDACCCMQRSRCVSRWSCSPPVANVVTVGHGHGPLKVLLAPLFVAFHALLSAVGGYVKRCLPASLSRVKQDHLIAGGVLGGDAARLLERVPKEVAISVMAWALCVALGQHTHATLASLAVRLGLNTPALCNTHFLPHKPLPS